MKYKKIETKSTKIETALADICARLDECGYRYERFDHYKPRYIQEADKWNNYKEILNTGSDVGTGYAWIKYYYEDRKFGYIFVCNHLVDCDTCTYNRFITIYNYTDDIADSNIPGDVPILACEPMSEDGDEMDPTTLYYNYVEFNPIISGDGECYECNGTGGIICSACEGTGIIESSTVIDGEAIVSEIECSNCHGKGYLKQVHECTACNGEGTRRVTIGIDENLQPKYGYVECTACNGIGHIQDVCEVCEGTGFDNIEYGQTQSAYYFYMDNHVDENGIHIPLNNYSKNIKCIVSKDQIDPLDDSIYVLYNSEKELDEHHKPDEAEEDTAEDELRHLEFYRGKYTENLSNNFIQTNIITKIDNTESSITNYAQHCVIKTFPSFDDIDGVINYVLYKDKNRPIIPMTNDISYVTKPWYIDYSFTDNTNNNFQLSSFSDTLMGCDYTTFDVKDSNDNIMSAHYFAGSFVPISANELTQINYPTTMPPFQRQLLMCDQCINNAGNLEYKPITGSYGTIVLQGSDNRIQLNDVTVNLAGNISISNFETDASETDGTSTWRAFNEYFFNKSSSAAVLDHINLAVVPVYDYFQQSNYVTEVGGTLFEVEIPGEKVREKLDDDEDIPKLPYEVETVIDENGEETSAVYVDYVRWFDDYRIEIEKENKKTISIPSTYKSLGFGVSLICYMRSLSDNTVFTADYSYNPALVTYKPTINTILVNGLPTSTVENANYKSLIKAFNLPFIEYDYKGYNYATVDETDYPCNESCYNYYLPEYGSYINSYKWYTFDEDNNILINKPDTFELHIPTKSQYCNFLTPHELKSIYTKNEYKEDTINTNAYKAFRITCPTCSGNLVDTYSARCRACAGCGVNQQYFYYKCHDFRDASVYDGGHAEQCDLDTDIPTIDDIPAVTAHITNPETQEVEDVEWPYLRYAAAQYYNKLEGMDGYEDACELVKYNTVLYKFNGDVNRYYWWDGTKHIMVNMGYNYIYRTKTVTKDCLILQTGEDDDGKPILTPGKKSMNFDTLEILYNDNLVLYRVLATLDEVDNIIGFYGYNLDSKQYERIHMYNRHVYNCIKTGNNQFNYFNVDKTIIHADNHGTHDLHYHDEDDTLSYPDHTHIDDCESDDKNEYVDSLNEKYYYKYVTKDRITYENLSFEVDQHYFE